MTQEQFEKMISGLVLDKDKYYKGDEAWNLLNNNGLGYTRLLVDEHFKLIENRKFDSLKRIYVSYDRINQRDCDTKKILRSNNEKYLFDTNNYADRVVNYTENVINLFQVFSDDGESDWARTFVIRNEAHYAKIMEAIKLLELDKDDYEVNKIERLKPYNWRPYEFQIKVNFDFDK
jgi:hypothetical protein